MLRLVALLLAMFSLQAPSMAADPADAPKKQFRVPADEAEKALKQLSRQSGFEVLFATDLVADVRTRPVDGVMTAEEALRTMLAGTGLVGVRDAETGSFTVRRAGDPNGGAAPVDARTTTRAANASAETSATIREDGVLELSAFEINASSDNSWYSSESLLGSRTREQLKNIPASIDAITTEFMEDMGAYTAFDAVEFAPNTTLNDTSGVIDGPGQADFGRISFRGIQGQWGVNRNFFRWYVPPDSYNTERIDLGRGSNTLLYGQAEPGGQATVYTKRANLSRTRGNVLAQWGSFDSYRFQLDSNVVAVKDRLALRLNAVTRRTGFDFDYADEAFEAVHLAVSARPFKSNDLTIRLEGEKGGYDRTSGTNNNRIREVSAVGIGMDRNNHHLLLPGGTSVLRRNNTLGVNGGAQVALAELNGGSGGLPTFLDKDVFDVLVAGTTRTVSVAGFDRDTNFAGPDRRQDREYDTWSAGVTGSLFDGKLNYELIHNYQYQLSSVVGARGFTEVQVSGNTALTGLDRALHSERVYLDMEHGENYNRNEIEQTRITMSYDLALPLDIAQRLVFIGGYDYEEFNSNNYFLVNARDSNNNGSLADERLFSRVYIDGGPLSGEYRPFEGNASVTPTLFRVNALGQTHISRYWSLSASGRYFGGRLRTIVGARNDQFESYDSGAWFDANRNADGSEIKSTGSRRDFPERFTRNVARDFDDYTYNFGVVYRPFGDVNVYASYADSYRWSGQPLFLDGTFGSGIFGETHEVGVKAGFLNDALTLSVSYFDLLREGQFFTYNENGLNRTSHLGPLFNADNLVPGDPNYVEVNNNRDVQDVRSKGFELSALYRKTRKWNLRLAVGYKDVTTDNTMPNFRRELAAAIARNDADGNVIVNGRTVLDRAQEIVANATASDGNQNTGEDGGRLAGTFSSLYEFDGALQGLAAGLNLRVVGDYMLGYTNGGANEVKGGGYFNLDFNARYARRIFGRQVTFRLNVRNVLEQDTYRDFDVGTFQNGADAGQVFIAERYAPPRSFLLSASMPF